MSDYSDNSMHQLVCLCSAQFHTVGRLPSFSKGQVDTESLMYVRSLASFCWMAVSKTSTAVIACTGVMINEHMNK